MPQPVHVSMSSQHFENNNTGEVVLTLPGSPNRKVLDDLIASLRRHPAVSKRRRQLFSGTQISPVQLQREPSLRIIVQISSIGSARRLEMIGKDMQTDLAHQLENRASRKSRKQDLQRGAITRRNVRSQPAYAR